VTARVIHGMPPRIDLTCQVAVVGGGACGLTAGLWARRHGATEVLVLERDLDSGGSTALSSGFVPAAGTRIQQMIGIDDSPSRFAADILAKSHGSSDPLLVDLYTTEIAGVIDTLADEYDLPFLVLDGFLYPGHSVSRMHTLPQRTGAALAVALRDAAAHAGVDCAYEAKVETLFVDPTLCVVALGIVRPDGRVEYLGCRSVVLACNGFGGNPVLVARFLPQMKESLYFGHAGNQGDAVTWGEAIGAELADMAGYQGPWLGGHTARHPADLGADDEGCDPGQRRWTAVLERAAGLFGSRRAGAGAAWRYCLERVRRSDPCIRARLSRLPRCRRRRAIRSAANLPRWRG
jgi:fumarate reductase flavoprotein subunit